MPKEMPTKIVFLDIDGVMIPATQYLIDINCGWNRTFPATTIAVINELCRLTGAKIVFNTTHNSSFSGVDDIEVAIVRHGLLAEYIHPTDFKTRYPSLRRKEAIEDWLSRHLEVAEDWVAIDDCVCAEDKHMILVNPSAGVDINNLNSAIAVLGGKPVLILL